MLTWPGLPPAPLQDIGEGVLFYGDSAAGGARASEWVAELHNAEDLRKFVNAQSDKVRGCAGGGVVEQGGRCTRAAALLSMCVSTWHWQQQLACACVHIPLHMRHRCCCL